MRVNSFRSQEIKVPSGVPQGSHLGPLLFNIYINDISSCFHSSKFLLFADDLKFYLKVSDSGDCHHLQGDLSRLVQWCNANGMDLNVKKCHSIAFKRGRMSYDFQYIINGAPLQSVSQVRDLGVVLDQTLSYDIHLSNVVSKALQMLGFIKRSTGDFQDIAYIKLFYCVLVRLFY